jgi:hypothetical protein
VEGDRRRCRARTAALLLGICVAAVAHGEESAKEVFPDALGPGIHPFYRKAIEAAIDKARSKLLQAACQNVLSDFVDGDGRSLAADLTVTGESAADFLAGIRFLDARWSGACGAIGTYAWTHPGSRAVHLCLESFAQLARTNPSAAANILIHEELHALGLGEDPPSSRVITARVGKRCGR